MVNIIFPEIDLKGVRGVMIDIDDTLYSYKFPHLKAMQAVYSYVRIFIENCDFEHFLKIFNDARQYIVDMLSPQGTCRSRLFTFQKIFEDYNIDKPYVHALNLEGIYWGTFNEYMLPSEHAKSFLLRCRKSQIPVCVVSDMQGRFQIQKLMRLGFDDYIEYMVTSEEAGCEKPHERIFLLALKKLGCDVENAIMIGDNTVKDIAGATSLGIKAYLVTEADD